MEIMNTISPEPPARPNCVLVECCKMAIRHRELASEGRGVKTSIEGSWSMQGNLQLQSAQFCGHQEMAAARNGRA
jgi:hypothetical protein